MSRPELQLSRQICFLVYRLEKAITARYRPLLSALGLTYPQYLVMLVLWERDGRSVGELCRELHLDTGTVSPLLKRLAQLGLVTRQRDSQDERSVILSLTAAGRDLEERAAAVPTALASCLGMDAAHYAELHARLGAELARFEG